MWSWGLRLKAACEISSLALGASGVGGRLLSPRSNTGNFLRHPSHNVKSGLHPHYVAASKCLNSKDAGVVVQHEGGLYGSKANGKGVLETFIL